MTDARVAVRKLAGPTVALGAMVVWLAVAGGCAKPGDAAGEAGRDSHGAEDAGAGEARRGPHGGRMLEHAELSVELQIEDEGIPPEFRAYLFDPKGAELPLGGARMWVVLERFAGRRDSLELAADGERFRSRRTVEEPHSYTARVTMLRDGKRFEWTFTQEEGRVELSAEAVASSKIETGAARSQLIEVRAEAPGEVRLNAERVVQVRPRFAGTIRRLTRRLGDVVRAGDPLATVTSNESLADYEITAPMGGTIVSRDAAEGQTVERESSLYTIADLSSVWVDFALAPQVASLVRRGQPVRIRSEAGETRTADGTVSYVGPLLEQDTRVSSGRVVLSNRNDQWMPGLFVTAEVLVDRERVPVAVPEEAIVRTSRGPAVFRADGSTFELQPVVPGRTDGTWTEIVNGLEPGARVVVKNAYLLKAELGKSEASHDH